MKICDLDYRQLRLGEIRINKFGSKTMIVDYLNAEHVTIKFENGFTAITTYQNFIKGRVRNPYEKRVLNIGYIGEGIYKTKLNSKHTKQYNRWIAMFHRCYSKKLRHKIPSYENCYVCTEWHNFQNFAKWCDENYYAVGNEQMDLDKDILIKGNKIYSPETCYFVPKRINILFTKSDAKRGNSPIGVSFNKRNNVYTAQCSNGRKGIIYLGSFDTKEKAFAVYKKYMQSKIKNMAEEYRGKIPEELYRAIISYEVNIND